MLALDKEWEVRMRFSSLPPGGPVGECKSVTTFALFCISMVDGVKIFEPVILLGSSSFHELPLCLALVGFFLRALFDK